MKGKEIKQIVKEGYGKVARNTPSCCDPSSISTTHDSFVEKISKIFGYSDEDIASVPEESNLGLG